MPSETASKAFQRLLATELSTLNRADLAAAMRSARVVRGWVDSIDIACARRGRELAAADGAESAESMLIDNGRRSGREAEATGQREQICNEVPDMEAALASGDVSPDHIDALARAAKNLTDAERADLFAMGPMLTNEATESHVESFARTCRDMAAFVHSQHHPGDDSAELDRQRAASKISRWVDRITGMHNTTISLDPVRDSQLWQLLDTEIARQKQLNGNSGTPFQLLQVEALFAALNHKHNAGSHSPTPASPAGTSQGSADHPPAHGHNETESETEMAAHSPVADRVDNCVDGRHTGNDTGTEADAAASGIAGNPDERANRNATQNHPSGTNQPPEPSGTGSNIAPSGEELCRSAPASGHTQPAIPEVYVHIDLETLLHGPHAGTISELSNGVPLPVSTIRRMCCDANIIPIVLNGTGELLDVGREHRTATRAQRRALRAIYRTCAHPHCTIEFDNCRIHHIHWWENGGTTNLSNLLPLCEKHHHQVHEGGWTITMAPNRQATWHHPIGAKQTSQPDRRSSRIPSGMFSATTTRRSNISDNEIYQPMLC